MFHKHRLKSHPNQEPPVCTVAWVRLEIYSAVRCCLTPGSYGDCNSSTLVVWLIYYNWWSKRQITPLNISIYFLHSCTEVTLTNSCPNSICHFPRLYNRWWYGHCEITIVHPSHCFLFSSSKVEFWIASPFPSNRTGVILLVLFLFMYLILCN